MGLQMLLVVALSSTMCSMQSRDMGHPVKAFDRWPFRYIYVFSKSSWWRHQMESFSALLALCAANSPVPVNSPHKGQWRGALMFSLIRAWMNLVNNREAGDLRRHRGHYDVIVMLPFYLYLRLYNSGTHWSVSSARWTRMGRPSSNRIRCW